VLFLINILSSEVCQLSSQIMVGQSAPAAVAFYPVRIRIRPRL
jgi:hypothetical protein